MNDATDPATAFATTSATTSGTTSAGREPARAVDATLLSYGWLPWAEARALLAGSDGVWLAPSGVTSPSGNWPTSQPLTTRIHAWTPASPAVLWRLVPRTQDGTVLVTALVTALATASITQLGGPESSGPGEPAARRSVQVVRDADGTWERSTVHGTSAVTFLRRLPTPAGAGT